MIQASVAVAVAGILDLFNISSECLYLLFKMFDPSLLLSSNQLLRKLLHSRPDSWIIFEILKLPLMFFDFLFQ